MANGQPLFLGSVEIRKNYVSFHVFLVYRKKRMQGKGCFNFRKVD